jgi:nucleotide-binding universal stress UspA family protein
MNTIVVPTDFSPAANNAVDYAVELAKFFNAGIILVNAYSFPIVSYEAAIPLGINPLARETAIENLEIVKRRISAKHQFNFDIECRAEMGDAFDVIKIISKEVNADLIVMGIVGDTGILKEYVIGSTATEVARKLEIPTFIIPENAKYRSIGKISFACDLNVTEETDLVYIVKYFSNIFNAELEIVNIEGVMEEVSAEKAKTSAFIEKKLANTNHRTVHVTENNVVQGLQDYFATHKTDVIMLNPKKHNLFHFLFNKSVTKGLVFHSKLPILAIH